MTERKYEEGLYRCYIERGGDDGPGASHWHEYDRDEQAERAVATWERVAAWISEQDGEAGLAECLDAMTRAQLVNQRDAIELAEIRRLLEILMAWAEDPAWFGKEAADGNV